MELQLQRDKKRNRPRRYSDWLNPTTKTSYEEKFLLSALSIKQLKPRTDLEQTMNKDNVKQNIQTRKKWLTQNSKKIQLPNLGKTTNPLKNQNDSYQNSDNCHQSQTSFQIASMKKNKVKTALPPIDMKSFTRPLSPVKSLKNPENTNKSRKKERIISQCKVIIQKNNIFPFINKCAKKEIKCDRSSTNGSQQPNFSGLDLWESQISQIQKATERQKFISKQSLNQIPIF